MKKIGILALILLLTGCLGGRSKPAEIYTLKSLPATEVIAESKISVDVGSIHLPKYLDRPQMVVQEESEISVSERNRWIEPLSDLMQQVLAEDIARQFPNAIVKQKTLSKEKFDYTLTIDISRLETILGDKTDMVGWWVLRRADGVIIYREKFELVLSVSDEYADMAEKQSLLIRQLADQIGKKLKTLR